MVLPKPAKLDNRKKVVLGLPLLVLLLFLIWGLFLYFQGGISPLIALRAYFAGYGVAYQRNYFDITGRTILANKLRYTPAFFDDLGGGAFYSDEPAWWEDGVGLLDRIYGVGVLKEWKEIPGSKDKHLLVTGPKGERELQLRVIFEPRGDLFGRYTTFLCFDI